MNNSPVTPDRGILVTFEGIDGAGKTYMSRQLRSRLEDEGVATLLVREPGGTEFGERLRDDWEHENLTSPTSPRVEALLFNAARAHLVEQRIRPALDSGRVVICDRFADSTIAYQGADSRLDVEELERLNFFATARLVPDLVVLLDVPAEVGLARKAGMAPQAGELKGMEGRGISYLDRVRNLYLSLAAHAPNRWQVLSGREDPAILMPKIWARVASLLERKMTAPTGRRQNQLL